MPESTRNLLMVLGMACFSGGILLMINHRRQWLRNLRAARHPGAVLFETATFRRRVILAGMIAACGTGLSALYWARDPRVIAAITGVVIILLLFVMWLALRDMLIIGLYKMGQADKPAQRELLRRYEELKRRRAEANAGHTADGSSSVPTSSNDEPADGEAISENK